MKVIIVSDSHGSFGDLQKIIVRETPFDLLIHLGDGIEELLRLKLMKDFNLDGVTGNNDPRDVFPTHLVLKLGHYPCFFTHGHLYQVTDHLDSLVAAAKKEKVAIAFYGHTHCYNDQEYKGVRLVNPGTVCRYLNKRPSYAVMLIEQRRLSINRIDL
jgi:phosphoesterase, MJ0936 family